MVYWLYYAETKYSTPNGAGRASYICESIVFQGKFSGKRLPPSEVARFCL
jgi:hypothetical protein